MHQIRAADVAGNVADLSSDSRTAPRAAFDVYNDGCDSTPPALETMTLSPTTVSNASASAILVSAVLDEAGSGMNSMSGYVEGPVATNGQTPKISFNGNPNPSDPARLWTATLTMPQYAAKGPWKVVFVRLFDKALNRHDYESNDPILAKVSFVVE